MIRIWMKNFEDDLAFICIGQIKSVEKRKEFKILEEKKFYLRLLNLNSPLSQNMQ